MQHYGTSGRNLNQQYLVQKQRRRKPLQFPPENPSCLQTKAQLWSRVQYPLYLWLCDSQTLASTLGIVTSVIYNIQKHYWCIWNGERKKLCVVTQVNYATLTRNFFGYKKNSKIWGGTPHYNAGSAPVISDVLSLEL